MTINKTIDLPKKPDEKIDVAKVFNIDSDLVVRGYKDKTDWVPHCLLYTSPSPRDLSTSRMPSSA